MLARLYGSNFRSLKADFELSMVAADLKREDDAHRGVIEFPIAGLPRPLRLLRVLALFGANASGKSNVLHAAEALNWLVTESSATARPDREIPVYRPFALDPNTRQRPVKLGCDVTFKDSLLRYEVEFSATAVERESLGRLSGDHEERLIDRHPDGRIRGHLIEKSKSNRLYVKEMQPNVSVLSKLAQHGPQRGKDSARPYHQAIQAATRFADFSSRSFQDAGKSRFANDAVYRDWIMKHLVIAADFGIQDVDIKMTSAKTFHDLLYKQFRGDPLNRKFDRCIAPGLSESETAAILFEAGDSEVGGGIDVAFVHEGLEDQPFDFSAESAGTQKILSLAEHWWTLAHEPVSLFADELGASLHPRLLERLVHAVNRAPLADEQSQLIFATHDTGLLEGHDGAPPALRRDQVYFTRKDRNGASELYSLAEFKEEARPVHNIRKRYLSGLYGAIPLVGEFDR